jgi:hypothetical protein
MVLNYILLNILLKKLIYKYDIDIVPYSVFSDVLKLMASQQKCLRDIGLYMRNTIRESNTGKLLVNVADKTEFIKK